MTRWTVTAVVLLVAGLLPAIVVTSRGRLGRRLVGYETAQIVAVLVVLCLAQASDRTSYVDVALLLAVLSPAAALVFTKFFTGDD
ncbi:MAG TPA: monovalent cation/H+ antiporter complex subunit F [Mycobacteriales bacterium]|nr:monovalent cation/H+ antiporter complex subunit F [Mycobacteriales bacterium]